MRPVISVRIPASRRTLTVPARREDVPHGLPLLLEYRLRNEDLRLQEIAAPDEEREDDEPLEEAKKGLHERLRLPR